MYRLYIVDDDPIICDGLSKNIDWAAAGVEVAGVANNGEQALALMQAAPPDVVIADINMARMDGIELTEQIRKAYPQARVILLSGHSEFRYAKSALSLQVLDYVLKPADNGLLLEKVRQAVAQIESEQSTQELLAASLPLLRSQFLNLLFEGRVEELKQVKTTAQFLQLPFSQPDLPLLCGLLVLEPRGEEVATWEAGKLAALQATERALSAHVRCACVLQGREVRFVLALGRLRTESGSVSSLLEELLGELLLYCELELGLEGSAGYGFPCKGAEGLAASYRQARDAMAYRHILGPGLVYPPDKNSYAPGPGHLPDCADLAAELGRQVRVGLREEALAVLGQLAERLRQPPGAPLEYIRLACTQALLEMIRACEGRPGESAARMLYAGYRQMQGLSSLGAIHTLLAELVETLCRSVAERPNSTQAELVAGAEAFIRAHYLEADLSLQQVADSVGVTPVYLSTLFKRETGKNFMEFLLELRMNRAMELLRCSSYKSYEVADMVGYNNPHYFSACFKNYTGRSPSEFRNL